LTRLEDRFLEAELREEELRLTVLLELDLERDTDDLEEAEEREGEAARELERELNEEARFLEVEARDEELRFGLE